MNDIKVWDIFDRVFHWTLVVSFFIAYITEDDVMWLHEFAGYTILALVAARLVWGVVGTKYARFSSFIFKPSTIKQYFKDSLRFKSKRYLGHNPLGGAMVVLLLIMLALTSWTGIEAEEEHLSVGSINIELITTAIADDDDRENGGSELWEEIHEFFANATLLLIFLHVAGVLYSSIAHGENLVRAMITGRKRE